MFDGSDEKSGTAYPTSWKSPAPDGADLTLEHFPSFRLALASTHVHRTMTSVYLKPYGLSLAEWRLLATVVRWSTVAMRDVCARSNMDKAQISRTVAALAEAGLIETTADPVHGRRRILRATAAGRRLFKRILPDAQRSQAALLAALTPDERAGLFSALAKLTAAATRFSKDEGHAQPRRQ
jgi:DNA-binding MarR family transcriptional regulator